MTDPICYLSRPVAGCGNGGWISV